jgi:hypothetical protein
MNQKLLKINIKNTTKQAGWKFWLWFGMFLLFLMIAIAISMSWLTRHAVNDGPLLTERESKMIVSIANFPANVKDAILELRQLITGDPLTLLVDSKAVEKPTWIRNFPVAEDNGYLLFSGVDSKAKQNVVKLIRIADGEEVVRWKPDFLFINNQITDKQWGHKGSAFSLQAVHPLLLNDASIIFNTGNSFVKQSSCSSKPLWVLDEIVHHSNELDETGKAVWAPSVSTDGFPENLWLRSHTRDDALGHFSLEGKLMERRSFSNILINNGLGSLLMGTSGFFRNDDPIHMNQIKVAKYNSTYWKRGDLLISARNISTLFLYRPSTNKILWHQTGPWMNQHSVDFIDDHRISVFSNNVVSGPHARKNLFLTPNDINRVYFFDFDKNQASQPYEKQLSIAKPVTRTAGRAQILHGGGLFVEESESGRHLRFTKDRLLWSRVNDYDDRRIGILSWSRYLTAEEVRVPLKTLAEKDCQNASKTH